MPEQDLSVPTQLTAETPEKEKQHEREQRHGEETFEMHQRHRREIWELQKRHNLENESFK